MSLRLSARTHPKNTAFQLTVRTTGPNETVELRCRDADIFDAKIVYGDGSTGLITTYDDADLTHEYAIVGDYQVTISGTYPNFRMNNGGNGNLCHRTRPCQGE